MKILVVDDHPLIQEALPRVLAKLHEDVEVVSAARFDEALAAARHGDINLILLDLGLPDTDGFAALAQFRQHHPTVPVVVLSATSHREVVLRALEEGAMGFVPKTSRTDILVEALRLVLAGGVYLPPEVVWHGQSISVGFKVALGGSPTPATKTPRKSTRVASDSRSESLGRRRELTDIASWSL